MWKSLELWAREALECCKQDLMGPAGKVVEDEILLERPMVKTLPLGSMGAKDPLETGLVIILVIFWGEKNLATFFHALKT